MYRQCLFLLIQRTGGRPSESIESAFALRAAAAASFALVDFLGFLFFFFFWAEMVSHANSLSTRVGEVSPERGDMGVDNSEASMVRSSLSEERGPPSAVARVVSMVTMAAKMSLYG